MADAKYDSNGIRISPYAEDATRGSSLIQPVKYKGDILAQFWVDSRLLATMTLWMEKNGTYPRSMSEVGRTPIELMVELLVERGEIEVVEDTAEARGILERRFRTNMNRGGRGLKNVLHNKVLSTEAGEFAETMRRSKELSKPRVMSRREEIGEILEHGKLSREEVERAVAEYKRIEEREVREQVEKQKEYMRKEGTLVEEPKPTLTKEQIEGIERRMRESKDMKDPRRQSGWDSSMTPRTLTDEEVRQRMKEIEERDRKLAEDMKNAMPSNIVEGE